MATKGSCHFCLAHHQEQRKGVPCLCGDKVCQLRWCLDGDRHYFAGPPVLAPLDNIITAVEMTINARVMHEAYRLPAYFFLPDGREFAPGEVAQVIIALKSYESALNDLWNRHFAEPPEPDDAG